jgi:hypothetical protein
VSLSNWQHVLFSELVDKLKRTFGTGSIENVIVKLPPGHSKIYKITKIEMGSSCNENGENKNHQKNNIMDSI